jgi:hypothetical protein
MKRRELRGHSADFDRNTDGIEQLACVCAERAKLKREVLRLSKEADSDIPMRIAARPEYAKLKK